ncbi:APC family permease, partial [Nocardioides hankookensis]
VLRDRNRLDGLERRSLPFGSVLAQSLAGAMPAAMALSTPALLSRVVGPGAWVSVLLAGTVLALVNACVCQFSTRVAASGSLFSFAAQGLGGFGALVVAVSMFLSYSTLAGWALAQSAVFTSRMTHDRASGDEFGQWTYVLVIAGFALVCLLVMSIGVRRAGRITLSVEAFTLLVLVGLLVAAAVERGGIGTSALSLEGADPERILRGTLSMFSIFFCFKSAASLGAETAQPFKYVPRATSTALLMMTGLSLVAVLVVTPTGAELPRGSGGSTAFWLPSGTHDHVDQLTRLMRLLCNLGCVLAVWASLARLVFSCARSGLLPRRFGRTHPSLRTPIPALVLTGVLVVGPALVWTVFSSDIREVEHLLVSASDIGFFLMYAVTCAAIPPFLRRIDETFTGAVVVARLGVAAISVAVVLTIWYEHRDGEVVSLLTLTGLVAVAAVWSAIARRRGLGPADFRVHDETVATDVYAGAGR